MGRDVIKQTQEHIPGGIRRLHGGLLYNLFSLAVCSKTFIIKCWERNMHKQLHSKYDGPGTVLSLSIGKLIQSSA